VRRVLSPAGTGGIYSARQGNELIGGGLCLQPGTGPPPGELPVDDVDAMLKGYAAVAEVPLEL